MTDFPKFSGPKFSGDAPDQDAAQTGAWSDALSPHLRGLSRRTLGVALAILPIVALINVAVLVWSLGLIDLSVRMTAPGLLGVAVFVAFIPMVTNSIRLTIWSRFFGMKLDLAGGFRVTTGTMIANSLTPPAVTGMPIRFLFLMGEGIGSQRAMSLISLQTAEDMLVLFSLVGICLGLSGFALHDFFAANPELLQRLGTVVQGAGVIAALVIGGIVAVSMIFGSRIMGRAVRDKFVELRLKLRQNVAGVVRDWAAVARTGKGFALLSLTLTAIQWSARFSIAGLVLAAFGMEWRPELYWLLQYLVQALSSVVPTPGGAGGAEAGFLLLFSIFVDVDVLVPAMSAWRLMHFYLPLAGAALVFFWMRHALRRRAARPVIETAMPEHVPAE